MVKILGEKFSKSDMLKYFGDYEVAAGFKNYTIDSAKGENIHICEVSSGSGLRMEICKTRGMDIGRCYFKEYPISYRSCAKESHPCYYETFNDGWLRSFSGGLLVTGGLTSIGTPEIDNGEVLPLHGRISNIPSEEFYTEKIWENDELYFKIHGLVREAKPLNYNITLNRTITVKAGENKFNIHDVVTNEGFNKQEHMMLYHFNIGYPILDEYSKFYADTNNVIPRDEISKNREEPYDTYLAPTNNYPDVVYYHDINADENGKCYAAIINEKRNIGIYLYYSNNTLDNFTQWKFTGQGNYVAGIEPCNSRVNGRSTERNEGRMKTLEPQEFVEYDLEVGILNGIEEINHFKSIYKI